MATNTSTAPSDAPALKPRVISPIAEVLKPGDILLYSHTGFFDFLICEFTRSHFTHVEVVWNPRHETPVVASRNGIGPNMYPFDTTVQRILRPNFLFDVDAAMAWFRAEALGCGYGYWDLVKFLPTIAQLVPKQLQAKGMICSTCVDLLWQHGGADLFADDLDPGEPSPRDFSILPASVAPVVYDRNNPQKRIVDL